jgi:hypothetical protein
LDSKITYKGEIVREYLAKFPKSSTMAIARMIHNDHPIDFITVENARANVRTHRGERGDGKLIKNTIGERTEKEKKEFMTKQFELPESRTTTNKKRSSFQTKIFCF